MDKVKVLYIDDEITNLLAFKASFRRVFEVFTANSANEGIEILKIHPIEVVLSDQRMPGKTGVDFFEEIKDLYPTPTRILITAFSDIESIINAINKGNVYRYITKPWNNYELQLTIENAHQLYKLKEQNNDLNLKYKKVFSESTDPIILLDEEYNLINFNPATLSLINCRDDNFKITSFKSLFKDPNEAQIIIDIIKKNKKIQDYESHIVTLEGEQKICLISGSYITNSYDEFTSYQLIIKNITERSKTNQLLLKKIIETQEEERARISRDLHDGLGQYLSALKLHWESLKTNYSQQDNIDEELKTIPKILQETIVALRRVCFNTLPLVLNDYGLIKAINELQTNFSNNDFNIIFNHNKNFPLLTKSLEISIFRIIQEFITNSLKHSKATEVKIELKDNKENIVLNLKDNGMGFNINDLVLFKGHGLKNIQNRVNSINGKLKMSSTINEGTEFDIDFPIQLN